MWPTYSRACRKDVDALLKKGGSLSAYRANPQVGVEPAKDSWAWRVERDIERRFGVKHSVVVNSGTAALHCALAALRLKPGDEVICPAFSFSATISAVLLAGGAPVIADVDSSSFTITKETVSGLITKRTRAIMPVHLFGGLADVRGLKTFGLPIVEDAAQAVGARDAGGYSGTQGHGGAYSANGGKNCPAGEFGVYVTQSDEAAQTARYLMNHGENFHQKTVGLNYRPNELTACVAWHGLQDLTKRNSRRYALASRLSYEMMKIDHDGVFPPHLDWSEYEIRHAFYVFPFTLYDNRPLFIKRMKRQGIPVGAGYITPHLGKYPAFRKYQRTPLPVVEELSTKTLCILSTLTPDKPLSYAKHVAECMRKALK